MNRWLWFSACAVLGVGMLFCGLLVPAHLRAVNASVVSEAGRNTASVVDRGVTLATEQKLGAAQLLLQAAQTESIPHREALYFIVDNLERQHPAWKVWGGGDPRLETFFKADGAKGAPEPFTDFIIRSKNRQQALDLLQASSIPAVQELLRCRALTNTTIFPPSQSASGQAFDAALATCGLLLEQGHLTGSLSNSVFALAAAANRGGNPQPLEQMMIDTMSLGERFNWGQLAEFVSRIESPETLRLQANLVRKAGAQLPILFSAVELSGKPAAVAGYLMHFSQTGLNDLGAALPFGAGGVNELLRRDLQLNVSGLHQSIAAGFSATHPRFALAFKWLLYLFAGFLLAAAMHFARPVVSSLEKPLQVRGFHIAREFLFALGFLLVVLLLSEPFLAQSSQKVAFPFRLRLPTAGGTVAAGTPGAKSTFMNQSNILAMLLFFVLQGLLYIASVVKLAEIRRQRVGPRMKLRLLENEDHLFDAGLYLGFLGTIVSFIVYSLYAHHQFSLMVAYSSTSFGILFVSFFKIFHLRPVRRRLLLEAELEPSEPTVPAGATPSLASP